MFAKDMSFVSKNFSYVKPGKAGFELKGYQTLPFLMPGCVPTMPRDKDILVILWD